MSAIQFNILAFRFNTFLFLHKDDIKRMDDSDYVDYSEDAFEDKYKTFYNRLGGINNNFGHYYVFTKKAEELDEPKPYQDRVFKLIKEMTNSDIMDNYYDPNNRNNVILKIISVNKQPAVFFSFMFLERKHAKLIDDKTQKVEEEAGPSNWFQRLIQWINPPTLSGSPLVFDDEDMVHVEEELIIKC